MLSGICLARVLLLLLIVLEFSDAQDPVAPIFIIADDDREALDRLLSMLNAQWYYIPVRSGRAAIRYARKFATTAIFISDSIQYPEGGAVRLLQELIAEVGKPVVVLAETWSPDLAARWKCRGASDCIAHPTRHDARIEGLRRSMQNCILGGLAAQ